jgi:hypothetical protein
MRFLPSAEMLEAIRLLFEPEIALKALRDPATAPKIEARYERLKAGPAA